ncbi:MAG: sulfotransferase [Proteobacteria bacterium]|nr:sulfotransferase [Pseudomonadota bacterium]
MSLPNFMCIGAAKSGTTSLYDILRQHSDVFAPSFKEPHFFDTPSVYKNGVKWYSKTYFNNVKNEKCIGDFTPTYLFESEAPKRIFDNLGGEVKFIIILRNPVDRAYSHYLHSLRDEHESLSFEDALSNEQTSKKEYLSYLRHSYVEQGLYTKMIVNFFHYFPKENFLILNFEEEFVLKRKETINRILQFLELKEENLDVDLASNKASKARFVWIKKLMKKKGWWSIILKNMIPSLKIRQIVKNRIQRANTINFSPPKISDKERSVFFELYFKKDVENLEQLLKRKMNWDR